jgi:hypothetical protein
VRAAHVRPCATSTRICTSRGEALHPYSAGGAYVNYDPLAQVKAAYDPRNLFRVNQNIQPQR